MHSWGQKDFDWEGLDLAIEYISSRLRKYGRIQVMQAKEKFGTARIYLTFGWQSIHDVWRPGYYWIPGWYPYGLDLTLTNRFFRLLNYVVIPIHKQIYRYFYKRAVKKWPHLREEILCCADDHETLEGL